MASAPNAFLPAPPTKLSVRFGAVVQAVRNLVAPATEQDPLQQTKSSEAEARGYGATPFTPDKGTLAAWAYKKMQLESGRMAAMRDYEQMDTECPEVSSALDVIAEFSTQGDSPTSETFHIESQEPEVQATLTDIVKELKLDRHITPTARETGKFGGAFWELVADQDGQIKSVKPLPPQTMVRNEDAYGRLEPVAFTQIDPQTGKAVAEFAAWQIIHFRYQKVSSRMYGNSLLEACRRVYKQISLMEDGMVVGRLYRSHVRFAFNLPVDNMNKEQISDFIDEMKAKFKKKPRFNSETGRLEQFDSPMSAEEDFWLPTKVGTQSDVRVLQGQGNLSQIGDIEYFQNKLFASLKVPKALMGFERDVNAKSTLSTQDVNFARTLRRMQQILADGVRETLRRVMMLNGVDPETAPEWHPVFPPVSTTDELVQWQTELIKAQVAETYKLELQIIDDEYIYKHFLELDDDEIARLQVSIAKQKAEDQANAMELAQATAPPAKVVPGQNVAPAPPSGPPKAKPKTPTKQEASIIRRVRTLLKQDLNEAIKDEEVKLANLVQTSTQRFKALLKDSDDD